VRWAEKKGYQYFDMIDRNVSNDKINSMASHGKILGGRNQVYAETILNSQQIVVKLSDCVKHYLWIAEEKLIV
jgi:hypothetical protein